MVDVVVSSLLLVLMYAVAVVVDKQQPRSTIIVVTIMEFRGIDTDEDDSCGRRRRFGNCENGVDVAQKQC
jgi:hypothetical protein